MKEEKRQLQLHFPGFRLSEPSETRSPRSRNGNTNKLDPKDTPFHNWYRFVLSFPPHLVRRYIDEFDLNGAHTLLDPFCGTGTTLVEAKLSGVPSVGIEANPFAHFASSVKVDWSINPGKFDEAAQRAAATALNTLEKKGIDDNQIFDEDIETSLLRKLNPEASKLLLSNSISPLPLHKTLVLLDCVNEICNEPYYRHALLALAKALVFRISNLKFGPEVGVRKPKSNSPVVAC